MAKQTQVWWWEAADAASSFPGQLPARRTMNAFSAAFRSLSANFLVSLLLACSRHIPRMRTCQQSPRCWAAWARAAHRHEVHSVVLGCTS
jgi:hypothetical protein